MKKYEPIAIGKVESLCVNGESRKSVDFMFDGPRGDRHSSAIRKLSGHDSDYIRTSHLGRGDWVANWRSWTGLSSEEICAVEATLGATIPRGCLLENLMISGIENFSNLAPTTRLVFEQKFGRKVSRQVILGVWEKNGPCSTVGERLAQHHRDPSLSTRFVAAAKDKRGVMGLVLAPGQVEVGDEVLVYPPVG